MARELKRILNNRIGLSVVVEESSFCLIFSNGYHLGEILSKFGLQPDFVFLVNTNDEETKIRNFARVLPALEDLNMYPSFEEVQKITQAFPGTAVQFVYRLMKALRVLPMKDPKWTIEKATKFTRKGSWADFAAMHNIDYETYRVLDNKYKIPGEEKCRQYEHRLREFFKKTEKDFTLVPLRAEAAERNKYVLEWQYAVQKELDEFDKAAEATPPPLNSVTATVPGEKFPGEGQKESVKMFKVHESQLAPEINLFIEKLESEPGTTQSCSPPLETMPKLETTEKVLASQSVNALAKLACKKSTGFNKEKYLERIRATASDFRQQKMDLAREKQLNWMEFVIEKKREREETLTMSKIRQINQRMELGRKRARDHLIQRRENYDKLLASLVKREQEAVVRQFEYVRSMVNNGFWDMLGGDIFTEQTLQEWCKNADLEYDPQIYQVLCKNYNLCKKMLLNDFDANFFTMYEKVAINEGDEFVSMRDPDENPVLEVSPSPQIVDAVKVRVEVAPSTHDNWDTEIGTESDRSSDHPTLSWDNIEFEEYKEMTSRFSYEDLGWMSSFVSPASLGKRYLGHIVSCLINGDSSKPKPSPQFKYPPKFVSLWIAGQRNSQLKKTILTKLAATYNLEVINVADIIQEVVEVTLQLQSVVTDSKEKSGGRRKSKTTTPTKRNSLTRMSRGKSRSLAASVSSLASVGSPLSHKGDLGARILRSLMEDGAVDGSTLAELVDTVIDNRVVNPRLKTPKQQLQEIAATTTVTLGKKGMYNELRPDSKTELIEPDPNTLEPHVEIPPPFGWILTDLPMTLDVLMAVEQRLGVFRPNHLTREQTWISSKFVPDEFGPKPGEVPQSFFGAIIHVNCPNEDDYLPHLASLKPLLTPDRAEEEKEKTSALEPQIHRKYKTNSPQPTNLEDMDLQKLSSVFSAVEIKHQLSKFMSSLDSAEVDLKWQSLEEFYRIFKSTTIQKLDKWFDPQDSFRDLCRLVQQAFDRCSTVCAHGISPASQSQVKRILKQVCEYVWKHRSALRQQLAQRMIGLRIAKSVFHYLFKQDVILIRDIYTKCISQLQKIIRREDKIDLKTIGLAVYRRSTFPLKDRLVKLERFLPVEKRKKERQALIAKLSTGGHSRTSNPTRQRSLKLSRSRNCLEQAMISFRSSCKSPRSIEPVADNSFLHNWLTEVARSLCGQVKSWHRKNELRIKIVQLDRSVSRQTVADFPFIGVHACPKAIEQWNELESLHTDSVLSVMASMKVAEYHLAGNTRNVKELFRTCLVAPNTTVKTMIDEFATEYDRMHRLYPDVHPVENWRKKIHSLHFNMSNIVDRRHFGMLSCLRTLMQNNGYSEIIFELRNVCMSMVQLEIRTFRSILHFLWTIFCHVMNFGETDYLALPQFSIPTYELDENPLDHSKNLFATYNLEAVQQFHRSMVSASPADEQKAFLKITDDDEEFWRSALNIVRFFLDKCRKIYLKKIKAYGTDSNYESQTDCVHDSILYDLLNDLPDQHESVPSPVPQRLSEFLHEKTLPIFNVSPTQTLPERLVEESEKKLGKSDPNNWLDILESFDLEDILATVRDDVRKRQELKNSVAGKHQPVADINGEMDKVLNPEKLLQNDTEDDADRKFVQDRRHYKKICRILRETVEQETNYCMLKICCIAIEGTRKCNKVRNVAAETFYVLDCWLQDTHRKEQGFVDKFVETAINSLEPYKEISHDKPERWFKLANSATFDILKNAT